MRLTALSLPLVTLALASCGCSRGEHAPPTTIRPQSVRSDTAKVVKLAEPPPQHPGGGDDKPKKGEEDTTESTSSGAPPPGGPQADLRAGARRLEPVWPRGLTATYHPDPSLRWDRLRARLAGRPVQTLVRPLGLLPKQTRGEVQRSGEILALAIARQLMLLGWTVEAEGFSSVARAELDRTKQATARPPKPDAVALAGAVAKKGVRRPPSPLRLRLSGQGSFSVEALPTELLARISATVVFAEPEGTRKVTQAVDLEERVTAADQPSPSIRAEKAKERALAVFVQKLFRSKVEEGLCELVPRRR